MKLWPRRCVFRSRFLCAKTKGTTAYKLPAGMRYSVVLRDYSFHILQVTLLAALD